MNYFTSDMIPWKKNYQHLQLVTPKLTLGKREAIHRNFENKCIECGSQYCLEIHHVIPKSKGGTDSINNLKLLCLHCHKKVHKNYKEVE